MIEWRKARNKARNEKATEEITAAMSNEAGIEFRLTGEWMFAAGAINLRYLIPERKESMAGWPN